MHDASHGFGLASRGASDLTGISPPAADVMTTGRGENGWRRPGWQDAGPRRAREPPSLRATPQPQAAEQRRPTATRSRSRDAGPEALVKWLRAPRQSARGGDDGCDNDRAS